MPCVRCGVEHMFVTAIGDADVTNLRSGRTGMTSSDISGVFGIVPTPALPGAERWDAVETVNLEESSRMTRAIIDGGVDALLTNGTFGECASLTFSELEAFVDAVVREASGRIPVFAGATTLNTRDTIARGRALLEIGADGLFVGRPMWLPLDGSQIVRFYRDIAEALPGTPLIVYDNPGAFKGKISPTTYAELSQIPEIVAAKHVGLLSGGSFIADLRAVEGRIRLLPLESDWYYLARLFPSEVTACWSGNVACGPAPVVRLRDAVNKRDWRTAERISDDLNWALEQLFPDGSFEAFLRYSIQIDNAQFAGAGFIRPGPTRPPYTSAPDGYLDAARVCGQRWTELQERYSFKGPSGVVDSFEQSEIPGGR